MTEPMPTEATALLDLARRVEAATGPNYALEIEINRAVKGFPDTWPEQYPGALVSNYTASIDAAMALVPEGCGRVLRDCSTSESGKAFARLYSPDFRCVTWGKGEDYITEITDGSEAISRAETFALALTAAALRALATLNPPAEQGEEA